MVVSAVGFDSATNGTTAITIAAAAGEQERQEQDQAGTSSTKSVSSQIEEFDTSAARTNQATGTAAGYTLEWFMYILTLNQQPSDKAVFVTRTEAGDYESTDQTLTASFAEYNYAYANNPASGFPWSWAEVDAMELGSRASSLISGHVEQFADYWAIVDYTPAGAGQPYKLRVQGVYGMKSW